MQTFIHAEQMYLYYLIDIWKTESCLKKTLPYFSELAHLRVFIWTIFISPTISYRIFEIDSSFHVE